MQGESPISTAFTDLIERGVFKDAAMTIDIPDDWMQGRTTYGGLSAALCFETARRAFPDLGPLRSAQVSFIGPTGGAARGEARLLRRGKSAAFVEADLLGGDAMATRCVFVFAAPRSSQLNGEYEARPAPPPPDECPPFAPEGTGPAFLGHFETRLVSGARPAARAARPEFTIWARHRSPVPADLAMTALIAAADVPPPAVLGLLAEFAPVSSMTWMFSVLADAPAGDDGWRLLTSRAETAAAGYSSQDMRLWNSDGSPLLAGRQTVAVFA